MKRSEVLNLINSVLWKYLGNTSFLKEEVTLELEELSELVLFSLEKIGMTPPSRPEIIQLPEPWEETENGTMCGKIIEAQTWHPEDG